MTPGAHSRAAGVSPWVRAGSIGLAMIAAALATCAQAQDKYQVTDVERAACESDAITLCSGSYPDQDALLACMRTNETRLTPGCRPVFIAGLHRRGLR